MNTRQLRNSSRMFGILILFGVIVAVHLPGEANAQTVVSRTRLGGYAEDVTFVTSGALKDQLVMTNGHDLYSVALTKKSVLNRVCRIDHPEMDQFVNGFAFVESEGLFVMNNAPHPDRLYLFDQTCSSKGTRRIQYLNANYRPGHVEGLAYIPAASPIFPDHLIMVTYDDFIGGTVRMVVLRRDGVQVAEIFRSDWPAQFSSEGGIGDVTFLAPNRLLVSVYHPDSLWIMDFTGTIISGPLTTGTVGMGEGVVQMSDGRVVASGYPQSLFLFDKNLNRLPQNDRHDIIGLNVNVANGIAWDSDANRLLVVHDTVVTPGPGGIAGIPTTLDSATPVIDLSAFPNTRELVYLPQEDLVGTLRFAPGNERALLLFNLNGTLNSEISLTPASLGQNFGPPITVTYLPGSDEFAVGFQGTPATQGAEQQRLRVISRAGTLVRTIELGATGTGGFATVEYFEDPHGGGGRLIFLSLFGGRVFITDLNGNSRNPDGFLLGEFNSRVKMGLMNTAEIAAITSGPLAGAFAVVDANGGEIVIFRLD